MAQNTTLTHKHDEDLRQAYWMFAGIPRVCYKAFRQSDMEGHHLSIDSALANIKSLDEFARSFSGLLPFDNRASHKLVKIEPIPETNWRKTHVELISAYISELVLERVRTYQAIKLSENISGLLLNQDSRGYAGKLFEQAVHRAFEKGMKIQPSGITEKKSFTVHISEANPAVVRHFYTLSIRASKGSPNVDDKYFDQYLIPVSKTQESVDSLVITRKRTVFFQMTVKPGQHGMKIQGILNILNELPANAKRNIAIVFVLPSGDQETRKFGLQKVTNIPPGTSAGMIELVEKFPQYTYRFPLELVN
jgi:hypothetical protein